MRFEEGFNPFHATNIQAETMYKVLTPSIKTSIQNPAAYGDNGHIYVSLAG
jgi:hypothetical protein